MTVAVPPFSAKGEPVSDSVTAGGASSSVICTVTGELATVVGSPLRFAPGLLSETVNASSTSSSASLVMGTEMVLVPPWPADQLSDGSGVAVPV